MRKLNSKHLATLRTQMKPGQRVVEVVLTVRWMTTKDLEAAVDELTVITNRFNTADRIDGYLDAKVLTEVVE